MANTNIGTPNNPFVDDYFSKRLKAEWDRTENERRIKMVEHQLQMEQAKMNEAKQAGQQARSQVYSFQITPAVNGGYVLSFGQEIFIADEKTIGEVVIGLMVKHRIAS